jgi:hypothetical protein
MSSTPPFTFRHVVTAAVLAVGVGGCAQPTRETLPSPPVGDDDVRPRPSPYEPADPAEVLPQLDAVDRASAVAFVLGQVRSVDPTGMFAAYEEAMAFAAPEELCPEVFTTDGTTTTWSSVGCTTSAGATFGSMGETTYVKSLAVDDGIGGLVDDTSLNCSFFDITLPDGRRLEAGGVFFAATVYTEPGSISYTVSFSASGDGSIEGTGIGDAHPILNGSMRVSTLDATAVETLSTGARNLTLNAFMSADVGELNVSGLLVSNSGDACAVAEPIGASVSLRGAEHQWYDILFDAVAADAVPFDGTGIDPALCDGCGDTYFRGQHIGQTCLQNDQSPNSILLSWETSPW